MELLETGFAYPRSAFRCRCAQVHVNWVNGVICDRHLVLRFHFVRGSLVIPILILFPTRVNVPVLSVQITETAPRVSTVFKDLQRTLFFFSKLAVIVKLEVTAIGRPSGI